MKIFGAACLALGLVFVALPVALLAFEPVSVDQMAELLASVAVPAGVLIGIGLPMTFMKPI